VETYFEASFEKDVKQAKTLRDIANLKKLKGSETYYRIRFGKYRIGLEMTNNTVIFARCLHRKDVYRYFPKE